jgi:hypothetical protein
MPVCGIFCDLAKACDCVDHGILLTKLCCFGIKGSTANWFKSHLTEIRSPYTTHSTYSNWETTDHGIPQVSILRPLLVMIYTNDLPPTINTPAPPIIFAGDMNVITSNKNLDDFCMLSNKVVSFRGKLFATNKLTLKNCVFWDVTPCGSCKNRRFGGTWHLLHQGDRNQ